VQAPSPYRQPLVFREIRKKYRYPSLPSLMQYYLLPT
jgi:hypothetical protein